MPGKPKYGTVEERGKLLSQESEESQKSVCDVSFSKKRQADYQRISTISTEVSDLKDIESPGSPERHILDLVGDPDDRSHDIITRDGYIAVEIHNEDINYDKSVDSEICISQEKDTAAAVATGDSCKTILPIDCSRTAVKPVAVCESKHEADRETQEEQTTLPSGECSQNISDYPSHQIVNRGHDNSSQHGSSHGSINKRKESQSEKSSSHSIQQAQGLPQQPARQRVVYYQNRFITVNIDPPRGSSSSGGEQQHPSRKRSAACSHHRSRHDGPATNPTGACQSLSHGSQLSKETRPSVQCKQDNGGQSSKNVRPSQDNGVKDKTCVHGAEGNTGITQTGEIPPEDSATMQAIPGTSSMGEPVAPMGSLSAIPGVMNIAPSPQYRAKAKKPPRRFSVFDKVSSFLQDNRVKQGDKDIELKLRTINRGKNDSNIVLKKILNIIFLTTGTSLLVGVIIVILYTHFSKLCPVLKEPDNGVFLEGCHSSIGSLCQARCNHGYINDGSHLRICQNDTTWSGTEAKCIYIGDDPSFHEFHPTEPPQVHVVNLDGDKGDPLEQQEVAPDFVDPEYTYETGDTDSMDNGDDSSNWLHEFDNDDENNYEDTYNEKDMPFFRPITPGRNNEEGFS